ncbi:MAG: PQQ-binding-like beta-propeller repeat protein [Verrucomicrobiales bacterium]|nr:PQQ-binding-like beta-propeller repeat protein [Verrucomicrobiales bacterium]
MSFELPPPCLASTGARPLSNAGRSRRLRGRRWWREAGYLGALAGLAIGCGSFAGRAEWPLYRGPHGNGVSEERLRTDWNEHPPERLWRLPLTNGLSSVTISDGRVFTQVRVGGVLDGTDVCVALEAATGRFLWTRPVGQARYPDGGVGSDDGPRSTPVVRGGRVFVLGSYLDLHCFEVADGATVWSRDLRAELGGSVIPWQNAASPLLEGELLLLNCNASPRALVALRQSDGEVVWRSGDERMTHATPVPATILGERQVVFLTQFGAVSVRPLTGEVLWRHRFPYNTSTGASPVVDGEVVYGAAAYARGSAAARVSRTDAGFAAGSVWGPLSTRMIHWSTPVAVGGHIYGLFGQNSGRLRCLDLRDGAYTWEGPNVGLGAILLVDGKLLVATEGGEILLAEPDPTAYREIGRFRALNGRVWNSPAISDGVLYVRGTTELAAFDVGPPRPRVLRLAAHWDPLGRVVSFTVSDAEGQPLLPIQAQAIQLLEASRVGEGASWTPVELSWTVADGVLRGEVPVPPEVNGARFYVGRETD